MEADAEHKTTGSARRVLGWLEFALALLVLTAGKLVVSLAFARDASHTVHALGWVTLVVGLFLAGHGMWLVTHAGQPAARVQRHASGPTYESFDRLGYKSFVAWRYLLVSNRKVRPLTWWLLLAALVAVGVTTGLQALHVGPLAALRIIDAVAAVVAGVVVFHGILPFSGPSLVLAMIGLQLLVPGAINYALLARNQVPFIHLGLDEIAVLQPKFFIVIAIGAGLVGIAMFFGSLRGLFTFFTTVPIGGVWIGTAALVIVLSVMGGFESDLREKILGSNAHIQITREDGEFTGWRAIKAKIDAMPGIVASTPFAVSEIVLAANNAPMNVIIKGIDPKTVGHVTDLVSDLEDPEAMKRLEPLIPDIHDLRVPQRPRTGTVIDPPPADLPTPGDPIDFSGDDLGPQPAAPAAGDRRAGHRSGAGSAPVADRAAGDVPETAEDSEPGSGPVTTPDGDGAATGSNDSGTAVRELREGEPPPRPPAPASGAPEIRAWRGSGGDRAADGSAADHPAVDPPPPDLITSDEPPADYSRPDYLSDAVRIDRPDPPFDPPSLSRRTQALPGILVGRELVKQTHLYIGEEVRVVSPLSDPANPDATGTPIPFNRDYRVAGTFFTGMYEYDLKYVYVTLESLQEFLDRGDAIDGIEVRVDNPYDSDAFVARLAAAFGPSYRVQDWKELNRSLFSALKLEKIAMFLVLGIVILVASFSIVGNLIMVVVEKAREIALLKTLGATDVGVMQLFAIQGMMIGIIGTVLGVTTGLIGCWALAEFGFPLNENVYYIDRLPIHVDLASVLAAACAGILISIAATLYPAVVAARVRPAAGMRH